MCQKGQTDIPLALHCFYTVKVFYKHAIYSVLLRTFSRIIRNKIVCLERTLAENSVFQMSIKK